MEQPDNQKEQLRVVLHVTETEDLYAAGWNAALEAAAAKTDEFKTAFGDDTCASWAVWLRRMKK